MATKNCAVAVGEMVLCPFNPSHTIPAARIQNHLIRCQEAHPDVEPFGICRHNNTHVVQDSQLERHMMTCPDRRNLDHLMGSPSGMVSRVLQNHAPLNDMDIGEVWEDDPASSAGRPAASELNTIMPKVAGMSKAAKKKKTLEVNNRNMAVNILKEIEKRGRLSAGSVEWLNTFGDDLLLALDDIDCDIYAVDWDNDEEGEDANNGGANCGHGWLSDDGKESLENSEAGDAAGAATAKSEERPSQGGGRDVKETASGRGGETQPAVRPLLGAPWSGKIGVGRGRGQCRITTAIGGPQQGTAAVGGQGTAAVGGQGTAAAVGGQGITTVGGQGITTVGGQGITTVRGQGTAAAAVGGQGTAAVGGQGTAAAVGGQGSNRILEELRKLIGPSADYWGSLNIDPAHLPRTHTLGRGNPAPMLHRLLNGEPAAPGYRRRL